MCKIFPTRGFPRLSLPSTTGQRHYNLLLPQPAVPPNTLHQTIRTRRFRPHNHFDSFRRHCGSCRDEKPFLGIRSHFRIFQPIPSTLSRELGSSIQRKDPRLNALLTHLVTTQAKMCETIVVHHRCGHEDIKGASACFKGPQSFEDKNNERTAGLKGRPAALPWCSFQSSLTVRSIRLCSGCRKERRREARESRPAFGNLEQAWRWWKEWRSSEAEGEREERLREEAQRRKGVERRLSEMVDGWY
jgi:hypothetical protein